MISMQERFVILRHIGHGPDHYDLMLDQGSNLATWQFAAPPHDLQIDSPAECRKLPDHRIEYLEYEGPISGGRGKVTRIDAGEFRTISRDDDKWVFKAGGKLFNGLFALQRSDTGKAGDWIIRKSNEPV